MRDGSENEQQESVRYQKQDLNSYQECRAMPTTVKLYQTRLSVRHSEAIVHGFRERSMSYLWREESGLRAYWTVFQNRQAEVFSHLPIGAYRAHTDLPRDVGATWMHLGPQLCTLESW